MAEAPLFTATKGLVNGAASCPCASRAWLFTDALFPSTRPKHGWPALHAVDGANIFQADRRWAAFYR